MSEATESATAGVPALTLGWRLQMAMSHGGQTRYSMAEALGVGISTITRWTSDKSTPKKAFITQWAWLTRVSVDWLETGVAPQDFGNPTRTTGDGDQEKTTRYSDGTSSAVEMSEAATRRGNRRRIRVARAA